MALSKTEKMLLQRVIQELKQAQENPYILSAIMEFEFTQTPGGAIIAQKANHYWLDDFVIENIPDHPGRGVRLIKLNDVPEGAVAAYMVRAKLDDLKAFSTLKAGIDKIPGAISALEAMLEDSK